MGNADEFKVEGYAKRVRRLKNQFLAAYNRRDDTKYQTFGKFIQSWIDVQVYYTLNGHLGLF